MPHIEHIKNFLDKPKVMAIYSAWNVEEFCKELANVNLALFASINVRSDKTKKKLKPRGRWRIEHVFRIQQWNRGIKFCWTKTKNSFLVLC